MTLRLSSTSTSSTTASSSTGNPTVDRLLQDSTLSIQQKTDCLKTLNVILKNLMDPQKSLEEKYRTLKLDNAKLQEKIFRVTHAMELLEQTCGFSSGSSSTTTTTTTTTTNENNNNVLLLASPPSDFTRQSILAPVQQAIAAGLAQLLNGSTTTTTTITATNKKPRMEVMGEEKLSEKQKARRLLEEKEALEKIKAKEERQRNLRLLKEDKLTRETDPNWKPGLSAACAKSGSSISTFRDKYGEN